MEKATEPIMLWLSGHWGWVVAVFCLFFEITPVKIHPISWLLKWLGKRLTASIQQDIADLKQDTDTNYKTLQERLDATEKAVDMQRIGGIRSTVLDFANSCLNGRLHTKEEFDHVLAENTVYEELVQKYNIKNEVYAESYGYIKRVYNKCMDKRSFLTVPQTDPDD